MPENLQISRNDLIDLIRTQLNVDEELEEDTGLEELPGWDSLGILLLMAEFDERLSISISEDDLEGLQKVKDIIGIVATAGKLQA